MPIKEENALPPAMFIAGALGLDFLNSIATPVDEVVDWIGDGAGFLSWMRQAGLLTDQDLTAIRKNMSAGQLDAVAASARELREWFQGFVLKHKGHPLNARALEQLSPLNRLLGVDEIFWQIEPSGTSQNKEANPPVFHLQPRRAWRTPDSLLAPLAEEMAKLLCSADFADVKACEGKVCTLLFLDETRRRGRRWCSMAVCGNRAKSAAFAARAKRAKKKN